MSGVTVGDSKSFSKFSLSSISWRDAGEMEENEPKGNKKGEKTNNVKPPQQHLK